LALVSHPSLGLPPLDATAGDPRSAAAMRANRGRLADRALQAALDADVAFGERNDAAARAALRLDLDSIVARVADSLAANAPQELARWADTVAVRYRKRRVAMDDVIALLNGVRLAATAVVVPESMAMVDAAIDAAVEVLLWHRRIAGDAKKRHPLIAFIYKGA
jgi:hypothetical protein